ncbi:hypothetical protein SAV31267_061470 [Streptomyces avermitilis]|uniref:Ubiquitin Mut7-C domain-containing protein n=1 Tax=Streptomyces avermitilis TaxID=33903 RepID=A0A4D4MWT9_STRAX|nr:hypothetical protein SAV31267_061470 [Streptomyces avermitilis]
MNGPEIHVAFAPELRLFVPHERRSGTTAVGTDGASTLGHVVESLGVPLPEVGALVVNGRETPVSYIPAAGDSVEVRPVERPQRVPGAPLRFLLDVHLGTLARRLRLLGVDTAYESTDLGDPALAALSAAEKRVLLSRDRGLLRRRELWAGAYIYSTRPDDQLRDVLDRFAPGLAPGPGARRATAYSRRPPRSRSPTSWKAARSGRTTSSRSARSAGGPTGRARTTTAWRPSWSAPSRSSAPNGASDPWCRRPVCPCWDRAPADRPRR